ncbi:MAG: S8 family peptidase [Acidimicrobiia bacterium]|nr:S8 family peptidase [Acidimicrobiia bacterium]MDH4307028.1 S8 family peptidase [Acidimicrobiia bacterium]MDH5293207.1 S8 family peptidase [Acidimicrobiia bacterium]
METREGVLMPERKRVLVTFKPKDKRRRKADKTEVFMSTVDEGFEVKAAATMGPPTDHGVVYDVNEYRAPILVADLTDEQIAALEKAADVATVEEDGEMYAFGPQLAVEGEPSLDEETIPSGINLIKAPPAWPCSEGKAIKVAVLDTGIDYSHPDLAVNYRGGASFVADESDPMDYNGHGTHCAGTIAAAFTGAGVVGVAPSAYLIAAKVLSRSGRGAWSNLIAGIDYAVNDRGARILSMSLGAAAAPTAVEAMCTMAWEKGALLIAAAGNAAGPVGAPAAYESVMAVSAIDDQGSLASFSNRGPEVELCAPGVQVLSTAPGGGYRRLSGTSMACPHVAGAAAVAWGAHRWASNEEIRSLLTWRADLMGRIERTEEFGWGRVDAEAAACELERPPVS